mmetsp:Transcript_27977/g.41244  ORF Transcript_27977/g.41244 Transcript_27977/m.41244 type:complete len:614 (-) Transcript_27977:1533-3374(-)
MASPQKRSFRDAVASDMSRQQGENGCWEITDRGLGSDVLAISQLVRGGDPSALMRTILCSGNVRDITDVILLTFATRNCRGGKGEKKLAYDMFFQIKRYFPETAKSLLPLFAHYGYWKDLLLIAEMAKDGSEIGAAADATVVQCIELMKSQLAKDEMVLKAHIDTKQLKTDDSKQGAPEISLLAKWLPRENSHFDKKINFVHLITSEPSSASVPQSQDSSGDQQKNWKSANKAKYRKNVSKLTSFLELPEVMLSAQRFDEINFQRVASKATFKLSNTFLNETKSGNTRSNNLKRVRMAELFLEHMLEKGLKGGQLMPHEIVKEIMYNRKLSRSRELVLDAQWKDLWKKVVEMVEFSAKEEGLEFNPSKMVPLSDVSGSMQGIPMEVSIALGIGISCCTHPAFQNMILTFEERPQWHYLNGDDNIVAKVRSLQGARWGGSTNFEAAFDLILSVCKEHKLAYEDVPNLIVFSDMQFNMAISDYGGKNGKKTTMHEIMKEKMARTAIYLGWKQYDLKPIIYWNLRSTGGHPVSNDTPGAVLLSGFSPSLLKLVMNGEAMRDEEIEMVDTDGNVTTVKMRVTPEDILRKMLDDSLYDPVRQVMMESEEGVLTKCNAT